MRERCQTPVGSVIAQTRIARRNCIQLFAGTLRDRRLTEGKQELLDKSNMQTEPTKP
jgi:hypothetical protein